MTTIVIVLNWELILKVALFVAAISNIERGNAARREERKKKRNKKCKKCSKKKRNKKRKKK